MKKNGSMLLMVLFVVFIVLVLLFLSDLLYIVSINISTSTSSTIRDSVSIASWNLQNFGPIKAANDSLLNFYVDKLGIYDVFVIQEINDPTGLAIQSVAAKLPTYQYMVSNPAGRGSSKEQYAIFYTREVELLNSTDWTETAQDDFERPPLEATFKVKNWTFTLCTIHIKMTNVPQELTNLENLIGYPSKDTILLGDMNADGKYYYEGEIHHFFRWHWLITSGMDTTVAKSSHAYDRIIINDATENNFISIDIMKDVNRSQTDHYLISAMFNPDET